MVSERTMFSPITPSTNPAGTLARSTTTSVAPISPKMAPEAPALMAFGFSNSMTIALPPSSDAR